MYLYDIGNRRLNYLMGVEDGEGGNIHIGANDAATAVIVATVCCIILPETPNSSACVGVPTSLTIYTPRTTATALSLGGSRISYDCLCIYASDIMGAFLVSGDNYYFNSCWWC